MDNQEYLKHVVTELGKPVDYKWKLQSYNKDKTKALCVAFIDARIVTNRLNEVCVHGWHREHYMLGTDIYCKVGLVMPDGSVQWRADAGESDGDFQKTKTASSDSFKRAAKEFGIGLFLYDLDIVTLPVKKDGNYYNIVKPDGSKVWDLTKYINEEYNKPTTPKQPNIPKTPAPRPPAPIDKVRDKVLATPSTSAGNPPHKVAEAPKAESGKPISPNKAMDVTDEESRKAKAKKAFEGLDKATVLGYIIKDLKLKYVSINDFIEKEPIDLVLSTYAAVQALPKKEKEENGKDK